MLDHLKKWFVPAYPAIYEIVSIGGINYAVWIMVNFDLFI